MNELAVTKTELDQLRNEAANLRARVSKVASWKGTRIWLRSARNSQISWPTSRCMHNDLERSGENDRRHLETQVQMMENQTHIMLQRDIDMKALQSCLAKTSEQPSQAQVRESLVAAETSKHISKTEWKNLPDNFKATQRNLLYLPGEQQLEQEVAELRYPA
ncbi:hypothetical protein OG21DRAFT_1488425 [Imleria badia]|nr:hypothetical protein OG21DRAFT_1488425 [Imleria badia]